MNGVCGSFSLFMSAKYLLTNDEDYLWSALIFPVAGCMFDFMDGKIARWRKESSMLGQELDSLADLVRAIYTVSTLICCLTMILSADIFWSCPRAPCICRGSPNIPGHRRLNGVYLLRPGTPGAIQCNCRSHTDGCKRKIEIFRGPTHSIVARPCLDIDGLDQTWMD